MYTNNGDDMDLKRKYAHLLLDCLNLKKGDYLFVSIPTFASYFKKLIIEEAKAYGLKDIYFDEVDSYKKHDLLKKILISILILMHLFIINMQNWMQGSYLLGV
mgnify:CR=1 FL=1